MTRDKVSRPSGVPRTLELFTIAESAAILGVSRRTVTEWISAGALPVVRLGPSGRLARVRQVDLEAFIDRGLSGSVPARERAGEEADSEPPVA